MIVPIVHQSHQLSSCQPYIEEPSHNVASDQYDCLEGHRSTVDSIKLLDAFNVENDAAHKDGCTDPLKNWDEVEDIIQIVVVRIDWQGYHIEKIHHNTESNKGTDKHIELLSQNSWLGILYHKHHHVVYPPRAGCIAD